MRCCVHPYPPLMIRRVLLSGTALALCLARPAHAQVPPPPTQDTNPRPTAAPADVASPDAILKTLYDVISGPAGQKRDWNRFRSIMAPYARLIPTAPRQGGGANLVVLGVEDYIQRAGPSLERDGFFEVEVSRTSESYGNIMHAFSTYESRRTADTKEKPFARGINSIQLLKDGARWWVVTIYWDAERPGNEIPARYLKPMTTR